MQLKDNGDMWTAVIENYFDFDFILYHDWSVVFLLYSSYSNSFYFRFYTIFTCDNFISTQIHFS